MSSAQCYKYEQEKASCHQGQQKEHSLTQKVSDMASSIFKGHGHGHGHETHGQTQGHHPHHTKSQNQFLTDGHGHDASMTCQGKNKKRGERKKTGMLQKIKDGFSSDDGSSSSDSESDDEKCRRKC